jgi:type III restriction enzyme
MTQSLIINSPYEVPRQHWQQARDGSLSLVPERRPAAYEIFDARHNTRRTDTLDLGNRIRGRDDAWREAGYPGVTIVTRRLLLKSYLFIRPTLFLNLPALPG